MHFALKILRSSIVALCFAGGAAAPLRAEAGDWRVDSLRWRAEMHAGFAGGDYTPFWLMSNRGGLGSQLKNNGYVRGALFKDIDRDRKVSWGAGVELVSGWRLQSPFYVRQLYGELKYRHLGLVVGSRDYHDGFGYERLSTGDMLSSGNALPIPQVRVGIFDYTGVWGCRDWFWVKGYVAYGFFTDSRWQESWVPAGGKRTTGVLYHSKGLWLKGGNEKIFPLTGEVGIEMATQFGGKSYMDGHVIDMPEGWRAWARAFFPTYSRGSNHAESNVSSIEGNMLGSYDIALTWRDPSGWCVRGYFEHYFEDQSQMTFEYGWKDGLYGLDVTLPANRWVSRAVVEYVYTKDQTGAVLHGATPETPEQISGRDNYYNHSMYTGWQNWGLAIGNPLLKSPIYNANHELYFTDTRLCGWHVGLEGKPCNGIDWRFMLSYTRNWGTYNRPFDEVEGNVNALAEVTWRPGRLPGWYATVGVGVDGGTLLGHNIGLAVTVGKSGVFGVGKTRKPVRCEP